MPIDGPTITGADLLPHDIARDNNLRQGDIVRHRNPAIHDDAAYVVMCNPGEAQGFGTCAIDVALRRIGPTDRAATTITSNVMRQWAAVPYDRLTPSQRLLQAHLTWRPLSERSAEDIVESGPADDDQEAWHLLTALLPPQDQVRLQSWGDWPTTADLVEEVGRYLDRVTRGAAAP